MGSADHAVDSNDPDLNRVSIGNGDNHRSNAVFQEVAVLGLSVEQGFLLYESHRRKVGLRRLSSAFGRAAKIRFLKRRAGGFIAASFVGEKRRIRMRK